MFRPEIQNVCDAVLQSDSGKGSRLSGQEFLHMIVLAFVDVRIRERVDQLFWCVIHEARHHHRKGSILDDVECDSDRHVSTSLEMVNTYLFGLRKSEDVQIAVARSDDNLSLQL